MDLSLRSRALWVMGITLLCIGCDQATKLAARSWLSVGEVDSFLGDTVRLQLAANYGAFLSLGDGCHRCGVLGCCRPVSAAFCSACCGTP